MRKEFLDIGVLLGEITGQLDDAERGIEILCELLSHVNGETCHPYLEEISKKWIDTCAKDNKPCAECWREYIFNEIKKERREAREANLTSFITRAGDLSI